MVFQSEFSQGRVAYSTAIDTCEMFVRAGAVTDPYDSGLWTLRLEFLATITLGSLLKIALKMPKLDLWMQSRQIDGIMTV